MRVLLVALAAGPGTATADGLRGGADMLAHAHARALALNAEILASESATAVLNRWCSAARRAPAEGSAATTSDASLVRAERLPVEDKPPTDVQRERLGVGPGEPVRYRRVRLRCGERILSEAENWYVPARLPAAVNRQLDATDTPFGAAIRALGPQRTTIEAEMLWPDPHDAREPAQSPGVAGTEHDAPSRSGRAGGIPEALFEHRAVLRTRDQVVIAEVHEVYQRVLVSADDAPGSGSDRP